MNLLLPLHVFTTSLQAFSRLFWMRTFVFFYRKWCNFCWVFRSGEYNGV